jgi:hypothetical protein
MKYLSQATQLESLWIGGAQVRLSDAGVAHLAPLVNLKSLDLQGHEISDAGLESLRDLKKLQQLYVEGGEEPNEQITDEGIDFIASLPNLERLTITRASATDSGIQRLSDLKKLKELYLTSPTVSSAALKRLRAALPDAEVHASGRD